MAKLNHYPSGWRIKKKIVLRITENSPTADITKLNVKKRFPYKIIENHYQSATEEPLKLITGQDGSEKSLVINVQMYCGFIFWVCII